LPLPALLGLMILCAAPAWAGAPTGADFLQVVAPARAAGMAGARAALADDTSDFLMDPAALGQAQSPSLQVNHDSSVLDTYFEQALLVEPTKPLLPGSLGLMLQYSTTQGVDNLDSSGNPQGQVENYGLVGQLSYGFPLIRQLWLGASVKGLFSRLADAQSSGLAADVGLQGKLSPGTCLGLCLADVGSQSAYDLASDPLPTTLRMALASTLMDDPDGQVQAAVQLDRPWMSGQAPELRLGIEGWFRQVLAVRLGYIYGADLGSFSLGLGTRFMGAALDYAFVPYGELGDSHHLGLTLDLDRIAKATGMGQDAVPAAPPQAALAPPKPAPSSPTAQAAVAAPGLQVPAGALAASAVWRLEDSPVLLSGEVVVPRGLTLAVEPGVQLSFRAGEKEARLVVQGRLWAVGTQEQPIVLAGERGPGWGALVFDSGCDAGSRLMNARVEGGRVVINAAAPLFEAVVFKAAPLELGALAAPEVSHCILEDAESALTSWSSSSSLGGVHHNLFTRNRFGLYIKDFGSGPLRFNTFLGNQDYDILNASPKAVDAEGNWWGTQDLAAISSRVFDGHSNANSGMILVSPTAH